MAGHMRRPDAGLMRESDWLAVRRLSKTVECPWCHAPVGRACLSAQRWPLSVEPAHASRLEAAMIARAQSRADDGPGGTHRRP